MEHEIKRIIREIDMKVSLSLSRSVFFFFFFFRFSYRCLLERRSLILHSRSSTNLLRLNRLAGHLRHYIRDCA